MCKYSHNKIACMPFGLHNVAGTFKRTIHRIGITGLAMGDMLDIIMMIL